MDSEMAPPRGARHQEVHANENGDTVALACLCRIGRDHRYTEWLNLPENSAHLADARSVWERMAH
ncbi:hypothetical protein ITJ44_15355 [Clavibacter sp. VKM Ac-2873]|uniref:hypothetical protein n=1 Tax=Clavibacter sp. VKM Ac-2873 TaxID=2783813 RepID=UPI00188A02D6|nr:hypothetical protein [Clavibacter sp. VKM Ac-2873]MBF4619453.1 hypothetical protein [Clavibacter sp. VKM Ac-2873]